LKANESSSNSPQAKSEKEAKEETEGDTTEEATVTEAEADPDQGEEGEMTETSRKEAHKAMMLVLTVESLDIGQTNAESQSAKGRI